MTALPPTLTWWRRLRHHADTLYLMGAAVISGLAGLVVPGAKSQAITAALPGWSQNVWYGGIMLGGLIGGGSLVLGGRVGLIAERPARWLLAFLCGAFGVAVFSSVGIRGLTGAAFIGLFGLACTARAWEIRRTLRTPDPQTALRAELEAVRADLAALLTHTPHKDGPL